MPTPLIERVEKLPNSKIVLVGDLMLDRYIYGNAERLSPDAPVPVLNYKREDLRLGGAGRGAAHLSTLGAEVRVVSLVGEDDAGREIRKLLEGYRCDLAGLVVAPGRPSTTKVRLVGLAQHRHPQQMMGLDYEDNAGRRRAGQAGAGGVRAGAGRGAGRLPRGLQQGAAAGALVQGANRGGEPARRAGAGRPGGDRRLLQVRRRRDGHAQPRRGRA